MINAAPARKGLPSPCHEGEVLLPRDRRARERRVNRMQYRVVSRALALRRAFGNDTALVLLRRANIDLEWARELVAAGVERRQLRRRSGAAAP